MHKAKEWYYSNYGRTLQKLKSTVIEGVFGRVKVSHHSIARSKFRGLVKVEIQFLVTATALNLNKIVRVLDKDKLITRLSREISDIIKIVKYILRNFVNLIKELAVQPS